MMTDYHPDAYYHTRDELDAGTPGVVVTDSHEYGYCDEDYSDSEECAPTLRATEVP